MRVLAVIPARSGSKGVKDKNIKLLGGKPLLAYSIDAAKQSKLVSEIIVSTDSEYYAEIASKLGVNIPFIRPASLASDKAASIDVILHALEYFKNNGKNYDAVCLLQPTSPFRPIGLVDQAIFKFIDTNADALVSVLPVPHHFNPHWTFESDENGLLKIATGESDIIKRRQELPLAFFRDGSIYITKTQVLESSNSLYGNKLGYIENKLSYYANIDTEADWLAAEIQLKKLQIQQC